MIKVLDKKEKRFLVILCTIAYFVSYITRIDLAAVLVNMVSEGAYTQEIIALAISVLALCYGIGQLISGYLGDKIKPENIILCGFIVTGIINILVGFITNDVLLITFWGINGFAQAFMWPPIVKILTLFLTNEEYGKACVPISSGGEFGIVFVYLVAPLIISLLNFRFVFFIFGLMALLISIFWKISFIKKFKYDFTAQVNHIQSKNINETNEIVTYKFNAKIITLVGIIMVAILIQGAMRDGVSTWVPTYVSEVLNLDSEIAILVSVILPIFNIITYKITVWLQQKYLKNELLCTGVLFTLGVISTIFIFFFKDSNSIVSLIFLAILVALMNGINFVFISLLPNYFKHFGKASLMSGVLNSAAYIGSSIFTYSTVIINSNFGWNGSIITWALLSGLGCLISFLLLRSWQKFKDNHNSN